MIMDPRAFDRDLEQRGFSAFAALGPLAPFVSAAYARKPGHGGVHDLVLVVDRTDGSGEASGQSHRTSARLGPFSASLDDLRALARALPTSFFRPLTRITIVEIAAGPASDDDRRRLSVYTTPEKGQMFVSAAYVDVEGKTLLSTDGASPARTALLNAHDPTQWLRDALDLTKLPHEDVSRAEPVAVFAPRTVGIATFLCSPVAGAALLGWNFHRTRRSAIGLLLLALAGLALGLVAFTSGDAGASVLGVMMTFGGIASLSAATRRSFGHPIRTPSAAFAILLSLGSLIVVFLLGVAGYAAVTALTERSVQTAHGGRVIYDREMLKFEADKVAEILDERKVLGPGTEVTMETKGSAHTMHIVLSDPMAAKRLDVQDSYRELAGQMSFEVFLSKPVTVSFEDHFGKKIDSVTSP
jgi:hypothetical protein